MTSLPTKRPTFGFFATNYPFDRNAKYSTAAQSNTPITTNAIHFHDACLGGNMPGNTWLSESAAGSCERCAGRTTALRAVTTWLSHNAPSR